MAIDTNPHFDQPVRSIGAALPRASVAMVLLHGRGAGAADILGVAAGMYDPRVTYLAPEAAGNSWYPNSFLAPIAQNEPWLSSALAKVALVLQTALDAGLKRERVVICGFSQGACLATEFVARNPARYGAMIAFTGGLIGPPEADLHHPGDLGGTPALFSSGDPDPHVPWARVVASAEQFTTMGAAVQTMRHRGRSHTILQAELDTARDLLLQLL